GSAIQYMHNLPLLSESDVIWKQTALAWAYSTDGGTTWLGYDVNGNMVAKILSVVGLNAEWINSGTVSAEHVEIGSATTYDAGYDPATKRRVFTETPTTPYDIGDLWSGGSTGDLKYCSTARASGSYVAGDWTLATKYTDNTVANAKNTVFNQASQPTATREGDIWVDTDANNKVYVWSGAAWIDALGIMAYEDAVEVSKLGTTVIDGGYIKTGLVDASRIDTGVLNAARVAIGATSTYASGYDPTLIAVGGRNLALGTEIDPWVAYSADTSLYRSNVNVTNLVTNGNFVNATGWTANEGSLSVANNTATHTASGVQPYGRLTRKDSVSTVGHTYALTLRVRVTNSSCTRLSARIYNGTAVTIQENPVENQWYQLTVLQTITSPQNYIWIYHSYATAAIASGKKMEVQYVSCVDLTAHFPVTVPTQSVYARWIATQPHAWIDGTANTKGLYRTNSITAVSTVTGSGKSLGMQQSSAYRTMKLTAGATYTISVLARGNVNVNINACYILNAGAANQALTTSWQMTAAWKKFYVTFTANANTGASTGSHLLFRYVGDVVAYSTWFEIQEVKIEAGNKATDWCPDTLDMAFPDTTTIDGGNIKTGKIESHDGKTYFDLDGDEVFVEGTIDEKVVTVEMSAESPFCLSQEDDNGVMQKLIYVTDDTGFSGPNILVTSRYDINEDGKVDYKDVEAIVNYVLEIPYTPGVAWPNGFPSFSRMDMNGDGMVSSSDATYWSIGANVPDRITLGNRMLGLDYVGVWASGDSGATKTYIHTF
ncbi:MAG: dockerin type I domain-containing protein, partial [Oscillospiraceae bacterium]|nr:dockerin type I domain-containing protein [Oscillospiraceae bacterium]